MAKIRLVVDNKNKYNLIEVIKKFFKKYTLKKTHIEKRQFITDYLTIKFAQYQTTTGKTNFFPLNEALFEVNKLEQKGQIENYYKIIKKRMEKCI